MSRSITIAAGKNGVMLPNGRSYNAGANVTLSDEHFAKIDPTLIPSVIVDNGAVSVGGTASLPSESTGGVVVSPTAAKGIGALALRRDAETVPTGIDDGETTLLTVDATGRLKVVNPVTLTSVVGTVTTASSVVSVDVRQCSNVSFFVTGTFTGVNVTFEASLDSTNGTDGNWFGVTASRSNANTAELTSGVIATGVGYAWELSVNAYTFFRIRATAYTSGTATFTVARGTYATEPAPTVQTHPVTISGTPAVTVSSGTITTVSSITAGSVTSTPVIGTALTLTTTASNNLTSVKGSSGTLFEICVSNATASALTLKVYAKSTAPVVASDVPVFVMTVAAGGFGSAEFGPLGKRLPNGIAIAVTGLPAFTDNTNTAAGALVSGTYI